MVFRTLLFAGAAIAALSGGASIALANDDQAQKRQPAPLAQIDADGMPASSDEQQRRERTPRDMAPDTGLHDGPVPMRVAQSEKPADQRMTTPLPPTTGSEANAVTLAQVDRPDKTLINAPVETKDGRKIGEVAQVTLDARGKANEVVLNDRNRTRIAAGELVFQPDRGVLITQLSPSDLAPARRPASVPPRTSPTGGPQNSAPPDEGPAEVPTPDMPDTRPGQNGY